MTDLWVFGYGSLMWRPGFEFEEVRTARLTGYRRCFCIYSVHHRGSEARPGLVLGLDRGGTCQGLAFRVAANRVHATLAYLRAREQVNGVYREARVSLDLGESQRITGIAYLAERDHPSYAGGLTIDQQAALIRAARGISGANVAYLASTLDELNRLGFRERTLERVMARTGAVFKFGDPSVRDSRIEGLIAVSQRHPVTVQRLKPGDRRRYGYRQRLG